MYTVGRSYMLITQDNQVTIPVGKTFELYNQEAE